MIFDLVVQLTTTERGTPTTPTKRPCSGLSIFSCFLFCFFLLPLLLRSNKWIDRISERHSGYFQCAHSIRRFFLPRLDWVAFLLFGLATRWHHQLVLFKKNNRKKWICVSLFGLLLKTHFNVNYREFNAPLMMSSIAYVAWTSSTVNPKKEQSLWPERVGDNGRTICTRPHGRGQVPTRRIDAHLFATVGLLVESLRETRKKKRNFFEDATGFWSEWTRVHRDDSVLWYPCRLYGISVLGRARTARCTRKTIRPV